MKNIAQILGATTLVMALACFSVLAQSPTTTVDRIVASPGNFNEEKVTIDGLVTQFVKSNSSTTRQYILRGDFGKTITVITAEPLPSTNHKCRVVGIVFLGEGNSKPFLCELSRAPLEGK